VAGEADPGAVVGEGASVVGAVVVGAVVVAGAAEGVVEVAVGAAAVGLRVVVACGVLLAVARALALGAADGSSSPHAVRGSSRASRNRGVRTRRR